MRATLLVALAALIGAACSDEPAPDATPADPAWLTQRPENACQYTDDTLARFRTLVDGEHWHDSAWNTQGTLEAVHVKTGLVFVLVPAGEFLMGSPEEEQERFHHETRHRETVSSYLLCKTECDQKAWESGGGANRSRATGGDRPVEQVSWDDCHDWCRALGLRLPSEKEWEYACRAGTTTSYWSGNDESDLARIGWYDGNSDRTHVIGEKDAPNPWGLHDVHGNVWEWCDDLWKRIPDGRLIRGGSWSHTATDCRSADRARLDPGYRDNDLGFRPVASLPPE